MKHIYHSICHEASGVWIAVSELTQGQGKYSYRTLLATSLLSYATAIDSSKCLCNIK
jgi:hypothetical protein